MEKETFTRKEVILMLERPDILIDAVENEYTDYTAESLLELAEQFLKS